MPQRKATRQQPGGHDPSPEHTGYCLLPHLLDPATLTVLRDQITQLITTRDPATGVEVRAGTDEIAIACRAGDALVFSSHLWHRGTANVSGRPRRAITYAFRRT